MRSLLTRMTIELDAAGVDRECFRIVVLLLCVALTGIVSACGPATVPCGTFVFTGAPHSNCGIDMSLDFTFDPAACKAPATTATTIAYIQIVRIIDGDTGDYLAPNSEQQDRIVTGRSTASMNGWAVDRLATRDRGDYGVGDDGTFAGTLTTGSSTSVATLRDKPSGWPNNSWFDAVSVPDCLVGVTGCQDRMLGYYYWLFLVGSTGTVGNPVNIVAVEWHRDAVDESVIEWDADAGGLSKHGFPALARMP